MISLYVEDIPDSYANGDLHRLFSMFGVVKDVFIPRKISKMGKRFGFVRYDCLVSVEVAIQKVHGVWIQDKELKVKIADFVRKQGNRPIGRVNKVYAPVQKAQQIMQMSTNQVQNLKGRVPAKDNMMVGGLNQQVSRRRSYADVTRNDRLLEGANVTAKMMGNKQIEDDTVKSARFDVGKVKVYTQNSGVINHQMKLVVGFASFVIKVAEEQVLFVSNSNFSYQCAFHVDNNMSDSRGTTSMGDNTSDDPDACCRSVVQQSAEGALDGEMPGEVDQQALVRKIREDDDVDRVINEAHHGEDKQSCLSESGIVFIDKEGMRAIGAIQDGEDYGGLLMNLEDREMRGCE
ncbi:Serine arginine-rich splicing factor 2 [Dionaea muscipula]